MFLNDSIETTGTKSRRLERQRAQVIDREEKRFNRVQGVEVKAAAADVEFGEQLTAVGGQDAQLIADSNSFATAPVNGNNGNMRTYTVSSPAYDAPSLARRPEPVKVDLRPGGFISVTTGRARRRRRG